MDSAAQPLAGTLVIELAQYLPGAYAGRELARLGARVVRVEGPAGSPMRTAAPSWDRALRCGKESVVCDLGTEAAFVRALCARADVVLEGFRPGVATRLGLGPDSVPSSVVYCSITGFGSSGRHARRAGHDLNYLGWAGVLEDTTPSLPPVQIADLAAGALAAVAEVLAALVQRSRTGAGGHVEISMTDRAHDLVSYRLGGDPRPALLTGGLACYGIYETADRRFVTVAALEPTFFERLCELIGRPELTSRQYDLEQDELSAELAAALAQRPLHTWLELFDGEDVCVGPVATRGEAAVDLDAPPAVGSDAPFGAHTQAWRAEVRRP